jgi:preprotein translocase subunit SecE
MNAKTEPTYRLDTVKWLAIFTVVFGGVYANSVFAAEPLIYRILAAIPLAGIAVAIALQTAKGQATWQLAREANVEVRKVVWPTREETQTTLIVVVVVMLVALMLWGLDSSVSWLVRGVLG